MSDKIIFSVTRKINMGNYETIDIHFSYESEVYEDENLDTATKRVSNYVKRVVNYEVTKTLNKMGEK